MTLIPVSKISAFGESSRKLGRIAVDRPALAGGGLAVVDRLAEDVPEAAERLLADRDADRRAGVDHVDSARQAVGRVHGDRADAVVAQVLLHLGDQVETRGAVLARDGDAQRVVDLGQRAGEDGVDDDALDLDDLAHIVFRRLRSAIGLLKRRLHERMPAPRAQRRASDRSLSKARDARERRSAGPALLRHRGHTGLVVERSAVRRDERGHHPLEDYSGASLRVSAWPERRRSRRTSRSRCRAAAVRRAGAPGACAAASGPGRRARMRPGPGCEPCEAGPLAAWVLSTVVTPTTAATTAATRATARRTKHRPGGARRRRSAGPSARAAARAAPAPRRGCVASYSRQAPQRRRCASSSASSSSEISSSRRSETHSRARSQVCGCGRSAITAYDVRGVPVVSRENDHTNR